MLISNPKKLALVQMIILIYPSIADNNSFKRQPLKTIDKLEDFWGQLKVTPLV